MKTYKEQKEINQRKKEVFKKVFDEELYVDLVGFLRGKNMHNYGFGFIDVDVQAINITRQLNADYFMGSISPEMNYGFTEVQIEGILKEFSIHTYD